MTSREETKIYLALTDAWAEIEQLGQASKLHAEALERLSKEILSIKDHLNLETPTPANRTGMPEWYKIENLLPNH